MSIPESMPRLALPRTAYPYLVDAPGYSTGFNVLPRRWMAERTFAWLCRSRRLSKDDERLSASSQAFLYLAGIRLIIARLAQI